MLKSIILLSLFDIPQWHRYLLPLAVYLIQFTVCHLKTSFEISTLTNLASLLTEGKRKGTLHKDLYGLPTYETGDIESQKVIIIAVDIFGYDFLNTNLIADEFAKAGFYVVVPDILLGDPVDLSGGPEGLKKWKENHGSEVTLPVYHKFLIELKKHVGGKAKFFSVGYCFGAPSVVSELTDYGLLTAGAVAHPTAVTIESVERITKPFMISAAQTDARFTPELRHKTEEILIKNNIRFQMDLFSGVSHGFAIKGDIKDPVVKYAKEKCVSDVITWFSQF
ncbi:hypothetical protein DASC09_046960 [Saccharomycopsis crataegensis]|uniref:Dienelactone hydrolase domain-containing protein n=1 Tax=Saccharomycopsis crataegensis TaxID=43959 RepID=A0AAV5QS69_9ASCO|nr:hypothetical protein DASC09_046960 [Saccharomycopsis crataegensis]